MLIALVACGSAPCTDKHRHPGRNPAGGPGCGRDRGSTGRVPRHRKNGRGTTNTVKVTFDYNYDGAPESTVIEVEAGGVL